jgi:predicted nucleic acid-binding protein
MAKIFLDTAPVIYLIENHPLRGAKVQSYLIQETGQGSDFTTSVITLSEFSVIPARAQRLQPIADFHRLMGTLSASLHDITQPIAERAAQLRGHYPALKGMNSLQVACALHHGCDTFFTNDQKLTQITEVQVQLVDHL